MRFVVTHHASAFLKRVIPGIHIDRAGWVNVDDGAAVTAAATLRRLETRLAPATSPPLIATHEQRLAAENAYADWAQARELRQLFETTRARGTTMSEPTWAGRGELAGWTIGKMGARHVARFEGRLKAAADLPAGVASKLKAANKPAKPEKPPRPPRQQQLPLDAPPRQRPARTRKEPCHCPEQPARRPRPKKEPCAAGPAPTLLARKSSKAQLFVWFAPARKPKAKSAGGLRYVGGWPNTDAGAAMTAAKARPLPAGVLYVVDAAGAVVKTTVKGA